MLAVPLACTRAGEGEHADVESLRAATEELAAARTAFEADRAATSKELAELRKAVDDTNAKLAALTAERGRPVRAAPDLEPDPVMRMPLVPGPVPRPEPADLAMSLDPALGAPLGEDPLAGKVRCESDGQCKVQRAYLEGLLSNPATATRQARIVPTERAGVTLGYKLYGIRRGSLPKAVGLKNGDLVRSINGKPLSSLDEVMKLFTELRKSTRYDLEIDRRGVPLTLTLELVERLDP